MFISGAYHPIYCKQVYRLIISLQEKARERHDF